MLYKCMLLFPLAMLFGCVTPNSMHRPLVPTTSIDHLGERPENNISAGKIGTTLCKNEKYASECSVINNEKENYKLFIVEFDEQGRFYDDRQFQILLDYLKQKQKDLDQIPSLCTEGNNVKEGIRGLSIITVVHGWRHNAADGDSNLEDLKNVLKIAHDAEQQSDYADKYVLKCGAREVVGVYVGWRGTSLTSRTWPFSEKPLELFGGYDPFELSTVYDRKNTAQNVSMGSVRELLSVLQEFVKNRNEFGIQDEEAYKTKKASKASKTSKTRVCIEDDYAANGFECKLDRLIIVGHSFGGLIVFNALSESLLNSITIGTLGKNVSTAPEDKFSNKNYPPKVRMNADLIVLVNPAVEGARFEPIYQAILRRDANYADKTDKNIKKGGGFHPYQKPVLVSITAENDKATGFWFPLSRLFMAFMERKPTRNSNLSAKDIHSVEGFDNKSANQFITNDSKRYVNMNKEEKKSIRQTVGHIPRYWTHDLNIDSSAMCESDTKYDRFKSVRTYYSEASANVSGCLFCDPIKRQAKVNHPPIKVTYLNNNRLPRNSPVWIMHSTNTEVLDNHSGYEIPKEVMPFLLELYHQLRFDDSIFRVTP